MTVETIEVVQELIDECEGTSTQVDTVWEYENAYSGKTMFAVFTIACINDIYSSPAVIVPTKIYEKGVWYGAYEYLNG
jgi:hypothetical protein